MHILEKLQKRNVYIYKSQKSCFSYASGLQQKSYVSGYMPFIQFKSIEQYLHINGLYYVYQSPYIHEYIIDILTLTDSESALARRGNRPIITLQRLNDILENDRFLQQIL